MLISLIFFVFIALQLPDTSNSVPIHGDEFHYINRSVQMQYFLDRKFENPFWQGDMTIGPKLPEYFYGATLRILAGDRIDDYLRRLGYTEQNLCCSDIQNWELQVVHQYGGSFTQTPQPFKARLEPIRLARITAMFLSFGILILIFLLVRPLSIFAGILASGLFYLSPLFPLTLRAKGDAPLNFLLLLNIYILSKYQRNTVPLSIITCGLAVSTKLNGILSLLLLVSVIIFYGIRQKQKFIRIFFKILAASLVTVFIFILLHPYTWKHPVVELINTVNFYQKIVVGSVIERFPYDILADFPTRAATVYRMTLGTHAPYGPLSHFSVIPIPADAILFILGLASMVFRKNMIVLTLWCLGITAYIFLLLQFNWDRYYIPFVIVLCITESIGLFRLLSPARRIAVWGKSRQDGLKTAIRP